MKALILILATLVATSAASQAQPEPKPKSEHKIVREIVIADGNTPRLLTVQRGFFGVSMANLTVELLQHFDVDADAGVLVSSLVEGGPAQKAGIQVGDILIEVDGQTIGSQTEAALLIGRLDPGTEIPVRLFRDRKSLTRTIRVGERERGQVPLNWFTVDESNLGEDGHSYRYRFSTGPGEVEEVVLPGAPLVQVIERMHERLEAPEFQERIESFRSRNVELEIRLEEMEQRLEEMGARLAEALAQLMEEKDK